MIKNSKDQTIYIFRNKKNAKNACELPIYTIWFYLYLI